MREPILSLPQWLNIATGEYSSRKLVQPAQERIRQEIKIHFDDAVEAYCGRGLTEPQAKARALADLGDAYAAARRFRREHLTEHEANWFCKEVGADRPRKSERGFWVTCFFQGAACLLLVFLALLFLKWRHVPLLVPGILAAMGLANWSIHFWIERWRDYRFCLHSRFTLMILGWVNFAAFWAVVAASSGSGFSISLFVMPNFVPPVFKLFIWLKVLRIKDVGDELPPPGSTAA